MQQDDATGIAVLRDDPRRDTLALGTLAQLCRQIETPCAPAGESLLRRHHV